MERRGSHLETLKYCQTCSRAAEQGNLEMLKWARANDCPWDVVTRQFAGDGEHWDVLEWARANGCPKNARDWHVSVN